MEWMHSQLADTSAGSRRSHRSAQNALCCGHFPFFALSASAARSPSAATKTGGCVNACVPHSVVICIKRKQCIAFPWSATAAKRNAKRQNGLRFVDCAWRRAGWQVAATAADRSDCVAGVTDHNSRLASKTDSDEKTMEQESSRAPVRSRLSLT